MINLDSSNVFNVQASLTKWLMDTLATFNLPSWLSSYSFVALQPETDLPTPAFSVSFIDVGTTARWQGYVGESKTGMQGKGIMEINAWVSRSDVNWLAQRRTMQAMVQQAVNGKKSGVLIQDYSTPATPSNTSYLVRFPGEVETVETQPDPNADIERARLLVTYTWVIRS